MSEKLQQITDAIKTLNPEDFTGGGKPKVEALEASLGFDVSATERDDAWQAYQDASATQDDTVDPELDTDQEGNAEPKADTDQANATKEDTPEPDPDAEQVTDAAPGDETETEEKPDAAKKAGPTTIADVVKQKRAKGMKI